MDYLDTGVRRMCGARGQQYGLSLRQSLAFNFLLSVHISGHTSNCLHISYMIYLHYFLRYAIYVLGFGPLMRRAVTNLGLVYVRVSSLNDLVAYMLDFVHI